MKARFTFLIAILVALLLTAFARPAAAQTEVTGPPFLATNAIEYTMATATGAAGEVVITKASEAITFAVRLHDTSIPTFIEYAQVVCTGDAPNPVVCKATLGQAGADALNKAGAHSATVALYRQDIGETKLTAPFLSYKAMPAVPSKVRVLTQ